MYLTFLSPSYVMKQIVQHFDQLFKEYYYRSFLLGGNIPELPMLLKHGTIIILEQNFHRLLIPAKFLSMANIITGAVV